MGALEGTGCETRVVFHTDILTARLSVVVCVFSGRAFAECIFRLTPISSPAERTGRVSIGQVDIVSHDVQTG